jgi:hypothetical protein
MKAQQEGGVLGAEEHDVAEPVAAGLWTGRIHEYPLELVAPDPAFEVAVVVVGEDD